MLIAHFPKSYYLCHLPLDAVQHRTTNEREEEAAPTSRSLLSTQAALVCFLRGPCYCRMETSSLQPPSLVPVMPGSKESYQPQKC